MMLIKNNKISNGVKKIFLILLIVLSAALILNVNLTVAQAKAYSPAVTAKAKLKPAGVLKAAVKQKTKAKPASAAKAKLAPKTKVAATSKYKTTMAWDASGLKYLNTPSHFDYSSAIRNAVIKKVENYARREKIKVISLSVINSMRE